MRKLLLPLTLTLTLFSCGSESKQVAVNLTATPLQEMKEFIKVPKLSVSPVPPGSYVPAKFIRVYRCSYSDDSGNVRKGEFIWIKVRDERVEASF